MVKVFGMKWDIVEDLPTRKNWARRMGPSVDRLKGGGMTSSLIATLMLGSVLGTMPLANLSARDVASKMTVGVAARAAIPRQRPQKAKEVSVDTLEGLNMRQLSNLTKPLFRELAEPEVSSESDHSLF
jgi:hypothetical protein